MLHQFNVIVNNPAAGSPELYSAVRAGFVKQGKSLNQWCLCNAVNRQTAEKAIKGERKGQRSIALLNKVISAAFPQESVGSVQCS